MPIKCSKTKRTSDQVLEQLYIPDNNLTDIENARDTWSKFWPVLASDKSLLALEAKVLQLTNTRRCIAGPSAKHSIRAYRITGVEFTKPIDPSEAEALNKHHTSKQRFVLPLVKLEAQSVTMKNALAGLQPKVICKLVMHQAIFDASVLEEHEDNIALGNPIFELAYFVKELIDYPARRYYHLNERRPTIRNHGDLVTRLLAASENTAKLVEAVREMSSFDQLQPNTGYCLLVLLDAADGLHRVYLSNPHPLPKELQTAEDGMTNSCRCLDAAVTALVKMIERCSKSGTAPSKTK